MIAQEGAVGKRRLKGKNKNCTGSNYKLMNLKGSLLQVIILPKMNVYRIGCRSYRRLGRRGDTLKIMVAYSRRWKNQQVILTHINPFETYEF